MTSFDKRRGERSCIHCQIEYLLDTFTGGESFEGIIDNVSEYGVCLITSYPLKEGQEIAIKEDLGLPSKTAIVCWVEKHDEGHYTVGLDFIK
jgi:hypothetical protein